MAPFPEVEVLVVHGDDDVGHDSGHVGQDPAGHFLGRDLDHLLSSPVAGGLLEKSAAGKNDRIFYQVRLFLSTPHQKVA